MHCPRPQDALGRGDDRRLGLGRNDPHGRTREDRADREQPSRLRRLRRRSDHAFGGQTVFDLFEEEDGLDALFGLVHEALPEKLWETAYAICLRRGRRGWQRCSSRNCGSSKSCAIRAEHRPAARRRHRTRGAGPAHDALGEHRCPSAGASCLLQPFCPACCRYAHPADAPSGLASGGPCRSRSAQNTAKTPERAARRRSERSPRASRRNSVFRSWPRPADRRVGDAVAGIVEHGDVAHQPAQQAVRPGRDKRPGHVVGTHPAATRPGPNDRRNAPAARPAGRASMPPFPAPLSARVVGTDAARLCRRQTRRPPPSGSWTSASCRAGCPRAAG
jgi:hypothetical protein